MPSSSPTKHDLIVVGGGPAGSTTAAIAARAGLRVLLLEAGEHPRVHVGESLLPGIIPILEAMGALADIEGAGFTVKTGSTHWGWGQTPEWELWFYDSDAYDHAWLVDRSRFDEILFRAAARAGAEAHEHAAVKSFRWEGERIVGVNYKMRGDDDERSAEAPYTVDASGQAALLAHHFSSRSVIQGLQHRAAWAHFEGAGRLPSPKEGHALFAAADKQWLWLFPLSATRTSVGLIRLDDELTPAERADEWFDSTVRADERLLRVLGEGARRVTPVRHQRDWSYRVERACGPGWFAAGDSSGFIDPVLSTGVHLAMHAGWHAAQLIAELVRDRAREAEALKQYQAQHTSLFNDMLRMVRFFYQQNLYRDDYFWESKKILLDNSDSELRPRKAFMILTSGLGRNLALDAQRATVASRRAEKTSVAAAPLDGHEPDELKFVCVHLRLGRSAIYWLIEPTDPASPTLFQTANWHVNCIAPQLTRDPLSLPALAPHLLEFGRVVRAADTRAGEPLAHFWRRARGPLVDVLQKLPPELEVVRVFGE